MSVHLRADLRDHYDRFVERVASSGECWVLIGPRGDGAWVEAHDATGDDGDPLPVHLLFSDRAYAQRVAVDEWSRYVPHAMPLDMLFQVLESIGGGGERVGCNYTADLAGLEVEPEQLRRDLSSKRGA